MTIPETNANKEHHSAASGGYYPTHTVPTQGECDRRLGYFPVSFLLLGEQLPSSSENKLPATWSEAPHRSWIWSCQRRILKKGICGTNGLTLQLCRRPFAPVCRGSPCSD